MKNAKRTKQSRSDSLLDLPASLLLAKFGEGNPTPGSGCAAALAGLLACAMLQTSCKLTRTRKPSEKSEKLSEYVAGLVAARWEPELRRLFDKDCEVFREVVACRKRGNRAKSEKAKRRWLDKGRERLQDSTKLLHEMSSACVDIARHGIIMFDNGWRPAVGEPIAAIEAALTGARIANSVANHNLNTSFRRSAWAENMRQTIATLEEKVQSLTLDFSPRRKELGVTPLSSFGQLDLLNERPKLALAFDAAKERGKQDKILVKKGKSAA